MRFPEGTEVTQSRIDAVQAKVRRRVLTAFIRRGSLKLDGAEDTILGTPKVLTAGQRQFWHSPCRVWVAC